jgi:hypothetical protein
MIPVVSGSLTSSPCNGRSVIAGGASLRPKDDDRARRSNANDGKHVALVERSDGAGQLWPIRPHPTHLFFLGRSLQTQKKVEGSTPTETLLDAAATIAQRPDPRSGRGAVYPRYNTTRFKSHAPAAGRSVEIQADAARLAGPQAISKDVRPRPEVRQGGPTSRGALLQLGWQPRHPRTAS